MRSAMQGEFEIIEWIRQQPQELGPDIACGIGDDAAVLNPAPSQQLVVTADALVEEVHFRRRWISPRWAGAKSLAVNLSDLAAMGAQPCASLLSLIVPPRTPETWLHSFIEGFLEGAGRWRCPLVGGNLSGGKAFSASVTALGTLPRGEALLRSGAREGDLLALVGEVGWAAAGLTILQTEDPDLSHIETQDQLARFADDPRRLKSLSAHLRPRPQLEVAAWLRQNGLVSGMIDVSDGFAADLRHLAHDSGLSVQLSAIPTPDAEAPPDAQEVLHGGEDYALLAGVPVAKEGELRRAYPSHFPPLRLIGRFEAGRQGIFTADGSPLSVKGFDHFR